MIALLFGVFLALFFVVMLRAGLLEKNRKITKLFIKIAISWCLIFALLWIFNRNLQIQKFFGLFLGIEGLGLSFGYYTISKKHRVQLRVVLIADAIFIVFYNMFVLAQEQLSIVWLKAIFIAEWSLILQTFSVYKVLSRIKNYYKFVEIGDILYIVCNEFPIIYGKNDSGYYVVKIPVVGNIQLSEDVFIRSDDQQIYTIKLDFLDYEIRGDFPILAENVMKDLSYLVVTINEIPIRCW